MYMLQSVCRETKCKQNPYQTAVNIADRLKGKPPDAYAKRIQGKMKALANEDTLLPTQMFTRLSPCATFVADTNCVSRTQKMFLILFRNIVCPQQTFPSFRSMETQHSFCVPRVCAPKKHYEQQCVRNNVSSFARALIRVICAWFHPVKWPHNAHSFFAELKCNLRWFPHNIRAIMAKIGKN